MNLYGLYILGCPTNCAVCQNATHCITCKTDFYKDNTGACRGKVAFIFLYIYIYIYISISISIYPYNWKLSGDFYRISKREEVSG